MEKVLKRNFCEFPLVPKDFVTAPIFASKPQQGPRQVVVRNKVYTVGGFNPIADDRDRPPCPALDIRHGRALFTILSFVDRQAGEKASLVRFSINEFCKRYATTNGGRYSRDIRALLSDLANCWFKITHEDGSSESYRILKNISVHGRAPRRKPLAHEELAEETWFDEVELHPKFYNMLSDYFNIAQIHLKTFVNIRSPLAQAIYIYIPSRAVYHSEGDPFEITLKKLLMQVGHTVPEAKSVRKKIFVQNNNPVIGQLDRVSTVSGTLRVILKETVDAEDYKLLFWVEKNAVRKVVSEKNGILKQIWIKTRRPLEIFYKKTQHPLPELSPYQLELFQRATIKLEGNEMFFRQSLALLGEESFNELLAEAKSAFLENVKFKKSGTHRLIHYIKEALEKQIR